MVSYRTKGAGGYHSLGVMAAPLRAILLSFQSLAEEMPWFVLAQMEALGTSPTPWAASTINGLEVFPQLGDPHFQFLRYDLKLDQRWLAEHVGIKLPETQVARFRNLTDPGIVNDLYEVARTAAERQVKQDRLAGQFD